MKIDRLIYSQALAAARQSEMAHPGEEKNIEILLDFFPDDKNANILDYGCGLGGTIDFLKRDKFFENIWGFDIDEATINFAKVKYGTHFSADISELKKYAPFDLVYSLNVFYLIQDKNVALQNLDEFTDKESKILISDFYLFQEDRQVRDYIPYPFTSSFNNTLKNTHWKIDINIDISQLYLEWYEDFIQKIDSRRSDIIKVSNEQYFDYMLKKYSFLSEKISKGILGGSILTLKK